MFEESFFPVSFAPPSIVDIPTVSLGLTRIGHNQETPSPDLSVNNIRLAMKIFNLALHDTVV